MFSGNIESTIVIFAVITLNAVLGTFQHIKAEKSLESLKSLSSPSAKVIRGGRKIEIDSKNVVEGDLIVLEAGDLVVADGRIINNYSLQVNESSLTGESTNIDKNENNHVLYRVTPIYKGSNLLASGVQMESWSIEDNGKGIHFNVYCYNVQPGIVIDYATGKSHAK